MKIIYKSLLLLFIATSVTFSSCKKSGTTPKTNNGNLDALSGPWEITAWGGVQGNILNFTVDATAATGTITQVGTQPFGYAVGDKLFTSIIYNSPGRYNATGKFTYGTNNASSKTRAVILTLQNNNTQVTIDYPAIDADFPEIIYIFQKGSAITL